MFCFDCNFIECDPIECNFSENYKMNDIINSFLLAGDKFMPEMHLREPQFTYSACRPFTKTKKESKSLKKPEIQDIFTKMN